MIIYVLLNKKRKIIYEINLPSRVIITGKKSELILKKVGLWQR
jgi:hypothetical protein